MVIHDDESRFLIVNNHSMVVNDGELLVDTAVVPVDSFDLRRAYQLLGDPRMFSRSEGTSYTDAMGQAIHQRTND